MADKILETISGWRNKLLDLSKRNRLINCKTGRTGALQLEYPSIHDIWERIVIDGKPMSFPRKTELLGLTDDESDEQALFADASADLNSGTPQGVDDSDADANDFEACKNSDQLGEYDLLTRITDKALDRRLKRLSVNAATSLAEQGVHSLYLACGFLQWYESKDSDVLMLSPLLLLPVELSRPSLDSEWQVALAEEELIPNHCLTQLLQDNFEIELPLPDEGALLEQVDALNGFYDSVSDKIASHDRWTVDREVALGGFTFQKMAVWNDFGKNSTKIAAHPLCKALAGETVELDVSSPGILDATHLDDAVSLTDTFHVLDADSSQHAAIEAVKRGSNLILDGPPGTGKSQTIANIIAECLAVGKTVLFVSEKVAALEVVKRRLDHARLGDFCLECHSHKANKKKVIDELGRRVRLSPEEYPSQSQNLAQLQSLRTRLNAYVRALHEPNGSLGLTAFQIHGRLAALTASASSRCDIPNPLNVDAARLNDMLEAVQVLVGCRAVIAEKGCHPWQGVKCVSHSLTLQDDIQHHFQVLAAQWQRILTAVAALASHVPVPERPTMRDLEACLATAESMQEFPFIDSRWLEGDVRKIAQAYIDLESQVWDYQLERAGASQYADAAIDLEWSLLPQRLSDGAQFLGCISTADCKTVRSSVKYFADLTKVAAAAVSTLRLAEASARILAEELKATNELKNACDTIRSLLPWFDGDARRLAQSYLDLDALSSEYVQGRQRVLQYRDTGIDAKVIAGVGVSPPAADIVGNAFRARCSTVRSAVAYLRRLQEQLAQARVHLSDVETAVQKVTGNLTVTLSVGVSLPWIPKLVTLAEQISVLGKAHSSWFDAQRRDEVKHTIANGKAEYDALRKEREALSQIWNESAFTADTKAVLARSVDFHLLKRLLPGFGWRSCQQQLQALYVGTAPRSAPVLLMNASQLLRYHNRLSTHQALGRSLGDAARASSEGHVNWQAVLADLCAIDGLTTMFRVPSRLREAIVNDTIDKEALRVAAEELKTKCAVAQSIIAPPTDSVGAGDVALLLSGSQEASITDMLALVAQFEAMTQRWIADLEAVAGMLREGEDVHLAELEKHAGVFADLDRLRSGIGKVYADIQTSGRGHLLAETMAAASQFARQRHAVFAEIAAVLRAGGDADASDVSKHAALFNRLKLLRMAIRDAFAVVRSLEPAGIACEIADWSEKAALARWVIQFWDQYAGQPPPAITAALCDRAIRANIADCAHAVRALYTPEFTDSQRFLDGLFDHGGIVSVGIMLGSATIDAIINWLTALIADVPRLPEWLAFDGALLRLKELGLERFGAEVTNHVISSDDAESAFLTRFYRRWLDAAYAKTPELAKFKAADHEELIQKFRALDRQAISEGYQRIRASQLQEAESLNRLAVGAPGSSELGILLREVEKRKRHQPLRVLFSRIPWLLQRLKPCIMMSPLAVSTFFERAETRFDVVVFDEASQVRPHDAICALYRANQFVVAGDQKQLPPTSFFERQFESDSNEDEIDTMADFESILDICCTLGMPRQRLRWHYRSRRESLIAFSNVHFYDEDLITFPSVFDREGHSGVRLDYVTQGRWQGGASGGINPVEARRTADIVFEHLENRQEESVGVVTMNQAQQMLVLEEIEKRRKQRPDLEALFDSSREEPLFVKNLENVQGDERDAMIFSIGYGRDANGNFAMRFGPLNTAGGERRLNVAITRARKSVTVVSSIRAQDIDLARTTSVGPKLLRAYLDYAERGSAALEGAIRDDGQHGSESPFEDEVARELMRRGLEVRKQVGCGRYRIDIALVDPQQPGRYVLGVECDGRTYHSSATARDRDRLRQAQLESLGWRMCRVWSTDWVRDRVKQVERIQTAYQKALDEPIAQDPVVEPKRADSTQAQIRTSAPAPHAPSRYKYTRIDDVPTRIVQELLIETLRQLGATDADQLMGSVTKQLGFLRKGTRIATRIDHAIECLIRDGSITKDASNRLRLPR